MQKGLIRKGLVFSVIVLFISVGVQPVFAEESITSTLDKDEDCIECQELDRISLLKVKILLFKVKVVTTVLLSSRLGDIPEIKEDCQEILDAIKSNKLSEPIFICLTLLGIVKVWEILYWELEHLANLFMAVPLFFLTILFYKLSERAYELFHRYWDIARDLECSWATIYP